MDRRAFIGTFATGVIVVSLAARAQQPAQTKRIGWLWLEAPETPAEIERRGMPALLRNLGWIEGQNLLAERRYASGRTELLKPFAEELIGLKVDVIVAGGTVAALAAKDATRTIPIVVNRSADPILAGLVASLARPGGNITGISTIFPDLSVKRLQLLRELLPSARRVAEMEVPANPVTRAMHEENERAYRLLGMQPTFVQVAQVSDLETSIHEAARRGAQALHVGPEPLLYSNFSLILRAAQRHSLPVMVDNTDMLEAGGLISYAPDEDALDRQLAVIIDKILRGAKPADVPVQQPTKLALLINLRAAQSLGITVPQALLLRATAVIR
jgi:putative ABC transport system substrate-binding protein